jgi:hypothetical protein
VVTHSIELLTCEQYGCPGCTLRHFHRTSDDAVLTEVPEHGMFTKAQLAAIGRAAIATGAVRQGSGGSAGEETGGSEDAPDGEAEGDITDEGAQGPRGFDLP